MPQPVDLPSEMARVNAVDRIQQVADRMALIAMQRHADEEAQERLRAETQVSTSPEVQGEHVDAEAKRRNPYAGRRRHKERDHREKDTAHAAGSALDQDSEGRHLDVSV
jgi:hypothetical protein